MYYYLLHIKHVYIYCLITLNIRFYMIKKIYNLSSAAWQIAIYLYLILKISDKLNFNTVQHIILLIIINEYIFNLVIFK